MKSPVLPYTALLLLAACGAHPKASPATAADAPTTTATTTATPGDKAAKADGDKAKADEKATGPMKFASFAGPNVAPPPNPLLWVVAPIQNSDWTSHLGLFRSEVKRVDGTSAVVLGVHHEEVFVPGALTKAPRTTSYKKGQAVIVADSTGLIVGASFGRIKEVSRDGDELSYDVEYSFGGEVSEAHVGADALMPLEDRLALGAPIAFKENDRWSSGRYVGPGAQPGKSWLLTWGSELEQHAEVKPLVVSKVYKKGDKVWASLYSHLEPATVVDVLNRGLGYKVKDAEGQEKSVEFHEVTSPL